MRCGMLPAKSLTAARRADFPGNTPMRRNELCPYSAGLVELTGIEPVTSGLQSRRSPS